MFKEYYSIVDSEEKKFIIVQDEQDGRLAILKSVSLNVINKLKSIDNYTDTLPKIYEYGEDYIIEENIEGMKLLDIIEHENICIDELIKIIKDICSSLTVLHNHDICHMDISPENIIKSGNGYILTDYSASKVFGETMNASSYGTRRFCSPEHFGFEHVSAESDIYSLGKLLEHLLEYTPDCESNDFTSLINECTYVDKNRRIPNVQKFFGEFEVVCRKHTDKLSNSGRIEMKNKRLIENYISTEDMFNALNSIYDLSDFIEKNKRNFEKMNVVEYLNNVLIAKNLKKSDVIKKSGIERTYGYQLLNGTKKPSRDKMIQLCIGGDFSFEETQMALKRTGFSPLYAKCRRDCIIIYALKSKKSVLDTDILLDKFNEELLNSE